MRHGISICSYFQRNSSTIVSADSDRPAVGIAIRCSGPFNGTDNVIRTSSDNEMRHTKGRRDGSLGGSGGISWETPRKEAVSGVKVFGIFKMDGGRLPKMLTTNSMAHIVITSLRTNNDYDIKPTQLPLTFQVLSQAKFVGLISSVTADTSQLGGSNSYLPVECAPSREVLPLLNCLLRLHSTLGVDFSLPP